MDSAHALVPKLISLNKQYQSGVMKYVETYYTQHFFSKNRAPGPYSGDNGRTRPIELSDLDLLVTYAKQRGKPWPEIEKLAVEYIQQRYRDMEDSESRIQTPSFPANADAAQRLKDIRKQAQQMYKTDKARELLILIQQCKRLKNPWPELDAIQGKLQGKGISMNVETVDLSDIRIK